MSLRNPFGSTDTTAGEALSNVVIVPLVQYESTSPTSTFRIVRLVAVTNTATLNQGLEEIRSTALDFPAEPNALPREAQLEVLEQQSREGRRMKSPRERSRFGRQDSPRRPCYRAVRVR